MKLYNCKVRLNGSLFNVVAKKDVTAAEIALLRHIHSQSENANDPVIDIEPAGRVQRTDKEERARLAGIYAFGEKSGPALVHELLGVNGVKLPDSVDTEIEEAEEAAPVRRTRVAEQPAA